MITTDNYYLVPTPKKAIPEDILHYTDSGTFSFLTYLMEYAVPDDEVYDVETGEKVDFDEMYILRAVYFWMGHPIYHHNLVVKDGDDNMYDAFDEEEALTHSQFLHDSFGNYTDGKESIFPAFRALGWTFIPIHAVVSIQMEEQASMHLAMRGGNFELMQTVYWGYKLGLVDTIEVEMPEELDNIDPMGVNLNSSVSSFIDSLERGDQDEDDERPDTTD